MIPPDEGTDKGLWAKVREVLADTGLGRRNQLGGMDLGFSAPLSFSGRACPVCFFHRAQFETRLASPAAKHGLFIAGNERNRENFPIGANLCDTLGVYQAATARIALTQGRNDDKLKERNRAVLPD